MADDELAARRLPDWARKLADVRLGASLAIGVMPHVKWIAENPGARFTECPEHLLEVSIAVMGAETTPSALNPDPASWPHVAFLAHEICRIPWQAWRQMADAQYDSTVAPAEGAS